MHAKDQTVLIISNYTHTHTHIYIYIYPQQADVAGNILLFFYKKKTKKNKKNNKILPTTSAFCGAVVRNECRDHFSIYITSWKLRNKFKKDA